MKNNDVRRVYRYDCMKCRDNFASYEKLLKEEKKKYICIYCREKSYEKQ